MQKNWTSLGLMSGTSGDGVDASIIRTNGINQYEIIDDKYFENMDDLSGLSKNHPLLSLSLLIVLFSLAGIPPLAGFFAKFYVFLAVIEKQMYFLAIIGLLSTVIAAFYYLRIIKTIYFDDAPQIYDKNHNLGLQLSLALSTILILSYFIYPSFLLEVISKIEIYK